MQTRTGKKTEIWLALVVALGLQTIILWLPITKQTPPDKGLRTQIEVQLRTYSPPPSPAPRAPALEPETVTPVPPPSTPVREPTVEPHRLATGPPEKSTERDLAGMGEEEKSRLTNTILARQFMTEESAADRIFGKPIESNHSGPIAEFHYPTRQSLIAMLDEPMPEIPFAYTPGLINFAYDPGVAGDLQRFWDNITPEFGWTTKNGTEVKCILVLVIVGCGWK